MEKIFAITSTRAVRKFNYLQKIWQPKDAEELEVFIS